MCTAKAVQFVLFFGKVRSHLTAGTSFSPCKVPFLIQKITKQDKETIDKRVKEVPELDKTVRPGTQLLCGYDAQDRDGA